MLFSFLFFLLELTSVGVFLIKILHCFLFFLSRHHLVVAISHLQLLRVIYCFRYLEAVIKACQHQLQLLQAIGCFRFLEVTFKAYQQNHFQRNHFQRNHFQPRANLRQARCLCPACCRALSLLSNLCQTRRSCRAKCRSQTQRSALVCALQLHLR